MECAYFDRRVCRSCAWLPLPYAAQVIARQEAVQDAVARARPELSATRWLPPATSPEAGFRTKAKMVVGGTVQAPTLGILDSDRRGVDLRECSILDPALRAAMPGIARLISEVGLVPYDVARRSGELKYVLMTCADDGELLIRFVLRSRRQLGALTRSLPRLDALVPTARVVTANFHPTHEAIIEGPEEVVLTEEQTLPMRVGDVVLHLGARSFSQTNTTVASSLYRQVATWLARDPLPASAWDLYCGIGGFALHAAARGIPEVTGVEISEQAIASARRSALDLPPEAGSTRFIAADATDWARHQPHAPEAVVVNPPRRGIGPELAAWLDDSTVGRVVYSSCYPDSLARDLAAMPRLHPVEARLFDMFPHTAHAEVAVLLEREDTVHWTTERARTPRLRR